MKLLAGTGQPQSTLPARNEWNIIGYASTDNIFITQFEAIKAKQSAPNNANQAQWAQETRRTPERKPPLR
eukprot:1443078-Prymnesium_polylepis.1